MALILSPYPAGKRERPKPFTPKQTRNRIEFGD
jgi:hypothetical protein